MHSSGDGANTSTSDAGAVNRVRMTRYDVEVVGVARVRLTLRGRPVAPLRADSEEVGAFAAARCWQKDAIAIGLARELATFDTVHCRPFVGAVVSQFILLLS